MQSEGLPAVEFETKLIAGAKKSVLFAAVIADTAEEALALEKKIKSLPTVADVDSMVAFLTEDQTKKLELVQEIKKEVSTIRFGAADSEEVDIQELSRTLWSLQGYLGLAVDATTQDEPELAKQLASLRTAISEFRRVLLSGNTEERLQNYQIALFNDIQETFRSLRMQDTSAPLRPQDMPAALRNRFIGVTGKHLLQVYPKEDVWQRENQKKFVFELRQALDPDDDSNPIITGTPVQLYEYTTLLKESYEHAAWYALIAISILILIHFRSITCLLLSLMPVGVGMLWLMGMMGAFNVPFNPANIMTLPLVIGIGVTNGIHILNRFAEEQNPALLGKSTGKAVLVSGLTTIAGFGSLLIAEHRGIASLGFIMSIGVTMCMVAALTFLPATLTLLIRRGWRIKKPSGDMHTPTLGPEEPR